MSTWTFELDGVDITGIASQRAWTRRLNRPASAKFRAPGHLIEVEAGTSRLKVWDDSTLRFHGVVWRLDDSGDADTTYTEVTCYDPMIYFPKRLARDFDGDYSNPDFIERYETAPLIMESVIARSMDVEHEGPMGLTIGSVATGGPQMLGKPTDWPQTLDDIRKLLVDTGFLDLVINPTEAGGDMGIIDLYNGSFPNAGGYGQDLTGSVVFSYQTGLYNVREVRRSVDMETVCNKLRYLLGPRVTSAADPSGTQHWKGDVQRLDGCLPGNDGDSDPVFRCGPSSGVGGQDDTPLGDLINASRSDYYQLQEVRVYDANGSFALRPAYYRIWQNESILRARPRTLVYMTPVRGTELEFDVADLVSVEAGTRFRGGFSGIQRVYEFTVNLDNDGVADLGQLVVSADQEI
jgi:hypothetical protein